MAKSKLQLDASQAIKAVNSVATAIGKQREAVDKSAQSTRDQNKATNLAVRSLGTFKDRLIEANSSFKPFNNSLGTAKTRIKDLGSTADHAARALNTVGVHTRGAGAAMRTAAQSAETFAQRFNNLSTSLAFEQRAVQKSVGLLNDFNRGMRQVIKTMDLKNNALAVQKARVNEDAAAVQNATAKNKNLILSMQTIAKIAVGLTLHRAMLRASQGLIQATDEAIKFNIAVHEIRTLSDRAAKSTSSWSNELIQLSNSFGIETLDAAEAAYQALSNQVTTAGTSISFLREETRLSIVAAATLSESVGTTTAIINAWGLSTDSTREVNDLLFATVDRGRLRLSDLANTIGRVSILSSTLGVSFEEQQASIALLTRRGLSAEEAMTLLRNVQLKLVRPTETMRDIFQEWGVTSGENAIKTFTFVEVLSKLLAKANEGGDAMQEFGDIFGRVRAIIGAVGLTSGDLNKEIKELGDASKGASEAYQDSMEGFGRRAKIQLAQVKNFFLQGGTRIVRVLVDMAEGWGGAENALGKFVRAFVRGVQIWVSYRIAVIAAGIAQSAFAAKLSFTELATKKLNLVLATTRNRVTTLSAAFGALTFGATFLIAEIVLARHEAERFGDTIEEAGDRARFAAAEFYDVRIDKSFESGRASIDRMNGSLRESSQALNRFLANARADLNKLSDVSFEDLGKALEEAIKKPLDAAGDAIDKIIGRAEKLRGEAATAKDRLKEAAFDERVRRGRKSGPGVSSEEEVKSLLAFRAELARELTTVDPSDPEQFRRLSDEIEKITLELIESKKRIYEAGTKIEKTKIGDRTEFVPDPFSRTGFRKKTTAVFKEEAVNTKAAEEALKAINILEAQRNKLIADRLKFEAASIKAKEAEAKKLEDIGTKQRAAFEALKDTLSKADSFDPETGTVAEFKALLASAGKEAEGAGIGFADRLQLIRDLTAQLKVLEREQAKALAAGAIEKAGEAVRSVNERAEDAIKKTQDAQNNLSESLKQGIPEILSVLTELDKFRSNLTLGSGTFKDSILNPGQRNGTRETFAFLDQTPLLIEKATEALDKFSGNQSQENLTLLAKRLQEIDALYVKLNQVNPNQGIFRDTKLFGDVGTGTGPSIERDKEGDLIVNKDEIGRAKSIIDLLEKMREQYQQFTDAKRNVNDVTLETESLKQELAQVDATVRRLPQELVNVGNVGPENMNVVKASVQDLGRALDDVLNKVRRVNGAFQQGNNGQGIGAGAEHRAFGGTPQGTDRIASYLQPGETVFTRNASKQFAPLIGVLERVAGTNGGNSGSSINFGDINITAQPGTTDQQASQLVAAIKRQLRVTRSSIN